MIEPRIRTTAKIDWAGRPLTIVAVIFAGLLIVAVFCALVHYKLKRMTRGGSIPQMMGK